MKILSVLAVVTLISCGHKGSRGDAPPPADEQQPQLQLNVDMNKKFFKVGDDLSYTIVRPISADKEDVVVYHNKKMVAPDRVTIADGKIVLNKLFVSGQNEVSLHYRDQASQSFDVTEASLWAGDQILEVSVVDVNQKPVPSALVHVVLGDDEQAQASDTTDPSGKVSLKNIPARTLYVTASQGDLYGAMPVAGDVRKLTLVVKAMNQPSSVANNDFSQGLEGWTLEGGNTEIVEGGQAKYQKLLHGIAAVAGETPQLSLGTKGKGPSSATRTFHLKPGKKAVGVRVKFITKEVPGGFFGSEFNDYFSISIRSASGKFKSYGNSMNALGLSSFDSAGATDWYQLTLDGLSEQEVVEVKATVANVADGLYDSTLVVEGIEEKSLSVEEAKLYDIDSSDLGLLSLDNHPYFNGNSRVFAKFKVTGSVGDALQSMALEVSANGKQLSEVNLSAALGAEVFRDFTGTGEISILQPTLAFEIPGSLLTDEETDKVTLRLKAISKEGETAYYSLGAFQRLVKYDGSNRYGTRDEAVGGDDWILPKHLDKLKALKDSTFNDFANMNGGKFSPHSSHRTGADVDGWFDGYNGRDEATVDKLISYLESSAGKNIQIMFVTYSKVEQDKFWQAIKDKELSDGRALKHVILPEAGHDTHYHVRFF